MVLLTMESPGPSTAPGTKQVVNPYFFDLTSEFNVNELVNERNAALIF